MSDSLLIQEVTDLRREVERLTKKCSKFESALAYIASTLDGKLAMRKMATVTLSEEPKEAKR